jgi:hypothetical protein
MSPGEQQTVTENSIWLYARLRSPDIHHELLGLSERERLYPGEPSDVRGTLLGNILTATERRAGGRYGLFTTLALPRLRPLLPPGTAAAFNTSEDELRFTVRMGSASLVMGIVTLGLTARLILHGDLVLLAGPSLFFLMALSSYRNSLASALRYGEQIAVAFDLHRFLLYDQLRLAPPENSDAERELAGKVTAALESGYTDARFVPQERPAQ